MIKLNLHQKIPINFMKKHRAILLFHSTGSGKTLTALYSVYQFTYPIIIIGPKNSKSIFIDNIIKANLDGNRISFFTYTKIKKIIPQNLDIFIGKSIIIDEAHMLRSETMSNLYMISALEGASKIILLTATPIINYINDLAVLINIIKGEDVLPTDRILFEQMFYDDEKKQITNGDILKDKLKNTISYYDHGSNISYPDYKYHYINVVMSYEQIQEYIYYIKKIIYESGDVVDQSGVFMIDYASLPSKKKNMFLNVTRQLSNTAKGEDDSPKINAIIKKIKNGPYPIIVYSNFLAAGIYKIATILEKLRISYAVISGMTSVDKIDYIVNNYNNNKYKILLISSAGSESLNLKNTRQIIIMEPHWNESKIDQVIGRAIRYESHIGLNSAERFVDIYRYCSIFPKHIKNMSADDFLISLSKNKLDIQNKYLDIIRKSSIENNK